MAHYVHHVPGRLRIKSRLLKRDTVMAEAVQMDLNALDGIVSCDTNILTGSILVKYDTGVTSPEEIFRMLKERNYVGPAARVNNNVAAEARIAPNLNNIGEQVGKAVFGVVMEKALERSAVALLGAIL